MAPSLRRFRNRVRGRIAFFMGRLRTLFAASKREDRDSKSLRMCPFCRLIG
jgi:hypothetical protein